jgi:hypothetical protein
MRRALALAAAALLVLGCAVFGGRREPEAMIAVEWLGGFPKPPPPAQNVELLLDVSTSEKASEHGLAHFEAERLAALRLVDALPETASIGVSVLGARSGECRSSQALAASPAGGSRAQLRQRIASLEPAGEGSLAQALEVLAAAGRAQRVVAFSDLGGECGGDLCAAAAALVGSGTRLDLVVVGNAAPPACLADLAFDVNAPPKDAATPVFRIEVPGEGAPVRMAEGYADGRPVPVPAGSGLLVLDVDPPIRIGPIHFTPATLTRVQVLDFPRLDVPVREWRSSTQPIEPAEEAS